MFANFRQAMVWLHTWFGLVIGFVLMVCFFFGALSVFDREIDRWAIPDTRFEPQPMASFDNMLLPILQNVVPDEDEYAANMPVMHDSTKGAMTPRLELPVEDYWAYTTHRDPVLIMGAAFAVPHPKNPDAHNHVHGDVTIDPRSGKLVSDDALKIGSNWFYPLHYSLNWSWKFIGYWIVGLAGFTMLIALVTGVIMHRKIFREFFTFRSWRNFQRSTLDLHNLTGVVALPFHFFFAFTGLLIFASSIYFSAGSTLLMPLHNQHEVIEAKDTGLPHARSGNAAPIASVDAMVIEAKRRWAERDMAGEVGYLQVHYYGDENSYVSIYRAGSDRVALVGEGIHFKSSTGEVLHEDPARTAVSEINEFLTGLHLQHFEHWMLRWLYVLGGLLGAICIATGFIFYVEKRKQRHAKLNSQSCRVVDALAVTAVTGMVIAAIGMLVVNRLLPAELVGKGEWEKIAFWVIWIVALMHAFLRSGPVAQALVNPAWREQSWTITLLAIAAVVLNWITTGDHLIKTVFTEPYWPVAGLDLSLLVTALVAAWAARKLGTYERLDVVLQADVSNDEALGSMPNA